MEKVERIDKKTEGSEQLLELVTAIRDGLVEPDENDRIYRILQSRFPCNLSQAERNRFSQKDVVHIWYCKKPVAEYNMKHLEKTVHSGGEN